GLTPAIWLKRAEPPEPRRLVAVALRQGAVIGDMQHQQLAVAALILHGDLDAEAARRGVGPTRVLDRAAQAEERAPAGISHMKDAARLVAELEDAELAREGARRF